YGRVLGRPDAKPLSVDPPFCSATTLLTTGKFWDPHMAACTLFESITSYLRSLMTYILPTVITGSVILCGLWIVPDSLFGMYGNVDGKWGSWSARSILEWSTFL